MPRVKDRLKELLVLDTIAEPWIGNVVEGGIRPASTDDLNLLVRQINLLLDRLDSQILTQIPGNALVDNTITDQQVEADAPGIPGGLVLATAVDIDPVDGVAKPYIDATWNANS